MSNRIVSTLTTAAGTAGILFTALLVAAPGDSERMSGASNASGERMERGMDERRYRGDDSDRRYGRGDDDRRYRGDDTRLSDVVRQVEDRHQVRVREAEREYEHGRNLYELKVTDADGRWRKLYVTADGDIVRDRRDD